MRCPKCGTIDDKVIDSRLSKDGVSIRRRRECLGCEMRFTTYEVLEHNEMRVVKRDGRRETLDRQKLLTSIVKACEKRPIDLEQMERAVEDILQELESQQDREISSKKLGAHVMSRLHGIDPVAYVRYASVYREFQEVGDFIEEIESLEKRVASTPDQRELFKA
jgi:transcriptional repressor NrdR